MKMGLSRILLYLFPVCAASLLLIGCKSAQQHHRDADQVAGRIIQQTQEKALGKTEPFSVEPPSETLRKRLLLSHQLPYSSSASLGSKFLAPIRHWPKDDYLDGALETEEATPAWASGEPMQLTLLDALQIGARSSREYQSQKEQVFLAALDLDLERDEFRTTFSGVLAGLFEKDRSVDPTVSGLEGSADGEISQRFKSGIDLSTSLAVDLAKLLTQNHAESLGVFSDASISIPLLRGAGRHIVAEPLAQAERDVVYEIYEFERYKRRFAVQVAREYLGVLRQRNQVKNVEENYRGLIASARRARRLADSGRLPEFQFDQAVQDEFRARSRWIQGIQSYANSLDEFKITLGLPPDARIVLDERELGRLQSIVADLMMESEGIERYKKVPPADAPIELDEPGKGKAGPAELEESRATRLALENRLDLRIAEGGVYDAQRSVVIAADALRPELTLFGSAQHGGHRSIGSADQPDSNIDLEEGVYSALLTLDLGLERTSERNAYRESFVAMEQAVRTLQAQEDQVKLEVRNALRDLLEYREGIQIQAQAVQLAQKRVRSTNLLLQAGRAQIRDLLEAQEDLLSAQNSLNDAIVNYRIAELVLQRDLGMLEIDEKGLWSEIFSREYKQ